jgi:toluene monooxygenase system ferredoxin subunit
VTYRPAADLETFWPGEMRRVVIDDVGVLLINIEGEVFAYEDRCAHERVPLSKGRLDGNVLTCWAHGWQYDARTGQGVNPSSARLRRFHVKIEQNKILVETVDAREH